MTRIFIRGGLINLAGHFVLPEVVEFVQHLRHIHPKHSEGLHKRLNMLKMINDEKFSFPFFSLVLVRKYSFL